MSTQATCFPAISFSSILTQIENGFTSLLSYFFDPRQSSAELSDHVYTIGGVENAGYSCTFSVMLQEFAALPDTYLKSDLILRGGENEGHLEQRKELQRHLTYCVEKIRSGQTVTADEVYQLAERMQNLGWNKKLPNLLERILAQIFPWLFSVQLNPFHVYMGVMQHFDAKGLIFLGNDAEKEASEYNLGDAVFRVSGPPATTAFPPALKMNDKIFNPAVVHVHKAGAVSDHVVAYRRWGDGWVCCDDAKVRRVDQLPTQGVYTVLYTITKSPGAADCL